MGLDGYVLGCIISSMGNSQKVHHIRCDLNRRLSQSGGLQAREISLQSYNYCNRIRFNAQLKSVTSGGFLLV